MIIYRKFHVNLSASAKVIMADKDIRTCRHYEPIFRHKIRKVGLKVV